MPVNDFPPQSQCPTRSELEQRGAETQSTAVSGVLTSTASMLGVRALVDAVEKLGGDSARLLRAAGLQVEQFATAEGRLPLREAYHLCALALEETRDPALGLHWGELGTPFPSVLPLITQLVVYARDLHCVFEALARYGSLISDDLGYDLIGRGDRMVLRCRTPSDQAPHVRRFIAEVVVTSFFRILCAFATPEQIESVSFEYAAPAHEREYARIFARSVRFEQPFTGIVFHRAVLEMPQPNMDEGIHEALRPLAERRLLRLAQHLPYMVRVRELLIDCGWPARMNMAAVARTLGLSVRSLRRRLAAEGRGYPELEREAFAVVATGLLRDQQRTIYDVARHMGFSDASTFHRAFKRATGTTPSARRVELLKSESSGGPPAAAGLGEGGRGRLPVGCSPQG